MRPTLHLTLFLVCLAQPALSSSTFYPNCTFPSAIVNFVSSGNVRGTLDILWSSLFTLLICTWTVQHLNIPQQTKDYDGSWDKLKEAFKRSGTKVKWMLVTLIVPEFLVGRAFQDFMMTKKSCREMRRLAEKDGVKWTLTHAYYANMGGFILEVDSSPASKLSHPNPTEGPLIHAMPFSSLTSNVGNPTEVNSEVHIAQEGQDGQGLPPDLTIKIEQARSTSRPDPVSDTKALSSNPPPTVIGFSPRNKKQKITKHAYPNADQLLALRDNFTIPRLPDVSVKQIEDKSKGDAFIKATTLMQVLWLVIQVIVRGSKHLPVSQLEIAVIAFAACTFLTYIFFFPKPQNVTVADRACPNPVPFSSIKEVENSDGKNRGTSWFQELRLQRNIDIFNPIPNDADFDHLPNISEILTYMDVGMVVAGTIFGSIHLIAWNFHFPTPLESLLWKISSVYLAAVLPCYYLFAFLFEKMGLLKVFLENSRSLSGIKYFGAKGVVYLSVLAYFFARLCLLVLVFRSLLFLETETFVTTWAKEVPHLQ
jgi:hypothetical protein